MTMMIEKIEISDDYKILIAKRAMLNNSCFDDVAMANVKITNANLSDLEIERAQLGGAYIHNIGMPPKGHPMYDPDVKQRPLRFEDCDLNNSMFTNCNLSGITIVDCNIEDMKINGITARELLASYEKSKK
jgi:uncharacterized protein YjbI with pentapeptide repeats